MKKLIFVISLLSIVGSAFSQSTVSWEDYLEQMGQTEDINDGSLEQMYEELSNLHSEKIDLNTCTREQLQLLPFLTDQQVMDIEEYRDRVGRIETAMELYLVPSLDRRTIELMRQFVVFSPKPSGDTIPSLRNVIKYGRNTIIGDFKFPCYNRVGDRRGYLGPKYRHWLRYSFNYGQKVRWGITASQDAGEPFFAGKNGKGYDYYSLYFLVRDVNRLKTLVLGRYRLRFGMGLILNNGYGFGKLTTLSSIMSSSNHVFAHSSRSEGNYLQGVAATVNITEGLDITAFASYRKIDATLNKDSSSVTTILKSGYHRTPSEMNRRHNTSELLFGGNVNYFKNGFHVGLTGYYTSFNRKLMMNNGQLYRRWYPVGSSFYNMSIDYGYLSNRLTIAGETAVDQKGHLATINTVSYALSSSLTLTALQRYYAYQYNALYSQSFAEGGRVNDENGVFVGGNWRLWQNARLLFYTDLSYFTWPKYRASASSYRWDSFLQFDVALGNWTVFARYRMKMKEMNNSGNTALTKHYDHRGRLALTYDNDVISCRTQGDITLTDREKKSLGYMLSESFSWMHKWLRVKASAGYFHTDDYDSRVYGHESGLLYNFYFPSFAGHGVRLSAVCRFELSKSLMLVSKVGSTHYFDRSVISSGLQQINGSTQTDIELQIRWKF